MKFSACVESDADNSNENDESECVSKSLSVRQSPQEAVVAERRKYAGMERNRR